MGIKENLDTIKSNISSALKKSGRNKNVLILAVTKKRTPKEINEAIDLGITDIGENRVQELLEKYDSVNPSVNWHLIGHLQTNKVKYIADKVCMIHSVDSIKLAKEIDLRCSKISKTMDILIEVNSGEENKNGIQKEEIYDLIKEIMPLKNVRIRGLMTMAPLGADEKTLKRVFGDLYNLSHDIGKKKYDNVCMDFLSMGMSSDYETAVEEGSDIVRIGRSLFE